MKGTYLQEINTSSLPAENASIVNEIKLSRWITPDVELTEDQIITLDAIANQCVIDGGNPVLEARFLLGQPLATKEDCIGNEDKSLLPEIKDNKPDNGMSISPNPSNGEVNIALNFELTDNEYFSVSDITGKKVFEKNLESSTTMVNLNLETGIYFYTLWQGKIVLKTGKLVILQ